MTSHETAVKIAEAIMDTIERRRGIIKDDLIEAARGVLEFLAAPANDAAKRRHGFLRQGMSAGASGLPSRLQARVRALVVASGQ